MTATAVPPMPIKCVAAFAGGKRRLAPRIVELLGPHDTYIEPFTGGCSILFAKPRAGRERLFDANRDVVTALNFLADNCGSTWVIESLKARPFGRATFDDAVRQLAVPPADCPSGFRALALLVAWWQGPGGIAGTTRKPWFAQRHSKTGGDPAKRWESFVRSVPALSARLQGVEVLHADGLGLLEHAPWDHHGTAIYCDPPYLTKSFRYAHDFAPADHQRLADALSGYSRSRVVVSYYDDPADPGRLARLYPPSRWRRIDVEMSKNMSAARGKTARAVEVLLVNDVGGR